MPVIKKGVKYLCFLWTHLWLAWGGQVGRSFSWNRWVNRLKLSDCRLAAVRRVRNVATAKLEQRPGDSVSDPDSRFFVWIQIKWLKKRSKMLNYHTLILHFTTLYLSIGFI